MIANNKKIEILAPAGSVDRMKAAFSAGADACYIGGRTFGARAYAENPSEKELVEAVHYAHLHDKKLFLTVNTLIKERELKDRLYDFIQPYYEAGIDAVLVQDFGVMKFLHEHFPDLVLHASTQMTVCDTGTLQELKKYGIKRLVLSRELSLQEIAAFKDKDTEIECFVHGALCVCYSGQCSMSYFNGGRSGNRGSCAGPCRMDYNLYASENKNGPVPTGMIAGNPYLLSPKDMCAIDYIPEMAEAGVDSFKIEGRMKRPEYAALTAYLYRKWADFYLTCGKEDFHGKEAAKERAADISKLSDLYNRGSFTSGYLVSHNGKEMMADKRPNHNGVFVGEVKSVGSPKKKNVMTILSKAELNPQDVLEIREEADSVTPVYEFTLKDGRKKGESFFANFNAGLKIREGMQVFRTKNDRLLQEIKERLIEGGLKKKIRMEFYAEAGKVLSLALKAGEVSVTVTGGTAVPAEKKPVEEERVVTALLKLRNTEFTSDREEITVKLSGAVFFPMSELNELRRTGISLLEEEILKPYKKSGNLPVRKGGEEVREEKKERISGKFMLLLSSPSQSEILERTLSKEKEADLIFNLDLFPRAKLSRYTERWKDAGRDVYIRLPEIMRREVKEKMEDYFSGEAGERVLSFLKGFVVRNPEELVFVKDLKKKTGRDFFIISDTNLHVFNSEAALALFSMGIDCYTASLEQSLEETEEIKKALPEDSALCMVMYGREELMVMTQCQWKNKNRCVKELKPGDKPLPEILFLENRKARSNGRAGKFPVAKNCESCHNYIYMDRPLSFFSEMEEIERIGPDRLRIDFTFENETEIREVLKLAKLGQ